MPNNLSDEQLKKLQEMLYQKQLAQNAQLINPSAASPYRVQNPENLAAKQEPGLERPAVDPIELAAFGAAGPLARGGSSALEAGEAALAPRLAALRRLGGSAAEASDVGALSEYRPDITKLRALEAAEQAPKPSTNPIDIKNQINDYLDAQEGKEYFRQKALKTYKEAQEPIPDYLIKSDVQPPSYHPDIGPEVTPEAKTIPSNDGSQGGTQQAAKMNVEDMLKNYYKKQDEEDYA